MSNTNTSMIQRVRKHGEDIENLGSQLETKANENEVFLKENGININDFDETTRQTFLEAQGIEVNYVLGNGNVKGTNMFNAVTNVFSNYSEGKLYRANGVTSIIVDVNNLTTDYIEIKAGQTIYSNAKITAYESADVDKKLVSYGNYAVADYKNQLTIDTSQTATCYIRLSLLKTSIADITNVTITIDTNPNMNILKNKTYIPWLNVGKENIGFDINSTIDLTEKVESKDFKGKITGNINKTALTVGKLKRVSGVTSIDATVTNYRTTDYIPVVDGDIIYCETPNINYETVNSSKVITRYAETGASLSNFTIDNDSSYIRISFPVDVINESSYTISKNITTDEAEGLNEGNVLVPWLKVKKDNILSIDLTNNYNFWSNYLVVPDKLYFVKDYDYSIIADNFCINKRALNKDLKFEMTMPTYTELQTDTIRIKSPVAQKFLTRLNVIQENTSAKNRAVDVELNFKDVSKIANKSCNVLILGDSIINAMIPGLTKYWLNNFGLTPNFIGTLANDNKEFGYGDTSISATNGEGRGGWRTTDFLNTTKWLDGSHFDMMYSYKTFWSTTTGGFDFSYYMQQNFPSTQIDYVIIALGTNDIGGGHYSGKKSELYLPTESQLFDSSSEYYFPTMFDKIINSIKTYNSNVKIALAPPMVSGDADDFNRKARRLVSLETTYYRNVENVFVLGNYLAQGQYSGSYKSNTKTYHDTNTSLTYNFVNENDVHRNLAVAQNNALWFASWIANMMD